jgi:hypothetical protein
VHRAFAALAPDEQKGLEGEILELLARFNRAGADSLVVPGAYLEAVIERARERPCSNRARTSTPSLP